MNNFKYVLMWSYGMHHDFIYVSVDDFYKILHNMSEEFEIQVVFKDGITYYYFINYYGDRVLLGECIIEPTTNRLN